MTTRDDHPAHILGKPVLIGGLRVWPCSCGEWNEISVDRPDLTHETHVASAED